MQRIFDMQPELVGDTLALRPLRADDLAGLSEAAAAPEIWAGHPAKDRHQSDVFARYFDFLLQSGTTLAIVHRPSQSIIGCSRYYVSPDQPDGMSIGFTFLNNAYWGGGTNHELKRMMLDHAFQYYPSVWFHIDPSNVRSQKATAKLARSTSTTPPWTLWASRHPGCASDWIGTTGPPLHAEARRPMLEIAASWDLLRTAQRDFGDARLSLNGSPRSPQ